MNVLPASIYVPTEAREGIWSPGTSFRGVMGIETRSSSRIIRGAFPSAFLSFINRVLYEFLHVKPTLHSLHFPSLIILCYICCGVGFCLLIVCPLVPRLLNAYINILFNEFSLKVEIYCLEFLQIFIDHIYYFLSFSGF